MIIFINFFRRVFLDCTEAVATSPLALVTNFPEILTFIIGFSFTVPHKKKTETSDRMLTKLFVSIGSYSSEVRIFGTLITSTKVFSLITCKTLWPRSRTIIYQEILDSVPRDLRLRT